MLLCSYQCSCHCDFRPSWRVKTRSLHSHPCAVEKRACIVCVCARVFASWLLLLLESVCVCVCVCMEREGVRRRQRVRACVRKWVLISHLFVRIIEREQGPASLSKHKHWGNRQAAYKWLWENTLRISHVPGAWLPLARETDLPLARLPRPFSQQLCFGFFFFFNFEVNRNLSSILKQTIASRGRFGGVASAG